MRKILFLSLAACTLAAPAAADFMTYGVKAECMPELNLMILGNELYPGYMADKYVAAHREETVDKYRIYSFSVQRAEGQKEVSIDPLQYKFGCRLNGHDIEVEIQPDEESFNSDENSGCSYASFVTIKDNGRLITDKLKTYDCDRDVYISKLTIRPQVEIPDYSNGGALFVSGYHGDRLSSEYYYYDRIKFEPVDNIIFYQPYKVLPPEQK